jgi:hypothetical protein
MPDAWGLALETRPDSVGPIEHEATYFDLNLETPSRRSGRRITVSPYRLFAPSKPVKTECD